MRESLASARDRVSQTTCKRLAAHTPDDGAKGDREKALANDRESPQLDPSNENAKKWVARLADR